MKAPPISTALGVAAILFGGWWIWDTLSQPVVRFFTEEKKPQDYLFLFIMVPLLSLPGIIAALFGFRLTKQKAPRNYKGVMGAFSIYAVFWLAYHLQRGFPVQVPEKIENALSTFLTTIVIIPAYTFFTAWLMRKEGVKVNGVGSLIGKGVVFIVAFQIWHLGSRMFEAYAPIKKGSTYIYEEPWNFLELILPLASAYLFYKITLWRLAKSAAEPSDGGHPQGQTELNGSAPA